MAAVGSLGGRGAKIGPPGAARARDPESISLRRRALAQNCVPRRGSGAVRDPKPAPVGLLGALPRNHAPEGALLGASWAARAGEAGAAGAWPRPMRLA